jgi:hypothetical protein
MMIAWARAAAAALSVAVLAAGCSSAPGSPGGARGSAHGAPGSPSSTGGDWWPTYNRDNARSGLAPGLARAGQLAVTWRAQLDGAVYGQPLLLGGLVLAATENDSVYGLDRVTGRVVWHTGLGEPQAPAGLKCGNIDPLGITSTMAYDPASGSLFALAETSGGRHSLIALDPATGAVRWRRAVESAGGTAADTQQRSALTVAFGRVYVPFGGLFGDCGDYVGSVVGVPVGGSGPQVSYTAATRQGGIWAPGGLVVRAGALLAIVGNGASTSTYDGSDSVIALTPQLTRTAFFAPSSWAQDNASDSDLGAMTPGLVGGDVLAVGKSGAAYLLQGERLGGVGGQRAQAQVCPAYGSAAVSGTTVYVPCLDGTRAVSVVGGVITTLWTSSVPAGGSPTLGGGAVWAVDYSAGGALCAEPGHRSGHRQFLDRQVPPFRVADAGQRQRVCRHAQRRRGAVRGVGRRRWRLRVSPRVCDGRGGRAQSRRRQSVRGLKCAQHTVVVGVLGVGAGPHLLAQKDGGDLVGLAVIVLVPGDHEQAVVGFGPGRVVAEVLAQPGVALLDGAVVHVVLNVGDDE